MPRQVAVAQRPGGHHLGVETGAAADQVPDAALRRDVAVHRPSGGIGRHRGHARWLRGDPRGRSGQVGGKRALHGRHDRRGAAARAWGGGMRFTVTTPTAVVEDVDDIRHIRAEDESGAFGILPGHADFVTVLPVSVVMWRAGDGREGFVLREAVPRARSPLDSGRRDPRRTVGVRSASHDHRLAAAVTSSNASRIRPSASSSSSAGLPNPIRTKPSMPK